MNLLADELDRLAVLKRKAERVGRYKKDRDEAFKTHQTACLEQMEAERSKSHRGEDGTLFTRCEDRVKGQVEDRRKYLRWCLENDEGVQEFLRNYGLDGCAAADFYELLLGGLEACVLKENQQRCNAEARAHIDDEAPLPPGLTFRPDPYIQQRSS